MHTYIHCNIIYNSQDGKMDKENVCVHTHQTHTRWNIIHSHKKKILSFATTQMKFEGVKLKWNKSDRER